MNFLYFAFSRMVLFLLLITAAGAMLFSSLVDIFNHNLILNGIIFAVFFFGVGLSFYQLYRLRQENLWLDMYDQGKVGFPGTPKPSILTPLAILLTDRSQPSNISPLAAKTILSSIEGRLDDQRDVSRYITGLLIFLGLVGTFWGLSKTIGAIAGVITGIDVNATEIKDAFQNLKSGLQTPLAGMGYAFSSSLFGLVGSLIVSFFDMQIGKVNTRFYQNLEERLAFSTRLGASDGEGNTAGNIYAASLLEQASETMANLQTQINRSEEARISMMKSIQMFSDKLHHAMDAIHGQQETFKQVTHGHLELQHALTAVAQMQQNQQDDGARRSLRNIEILTQRMLDEITEGRVLTVTELQSEIRLIARTLSAIANGQDNAAA